MALSRIWSAFIIIAIIVASSKAIFSGDKQIFSQIVVGKADDAFDTVRYVMVGSPANASIVSKEAFAKYLSGYGYVAADSAHPATVIISDHINNDSVAVLKRANQEAAIYSYQSIQTKLVKK